MARLQHLLLAVIATQVYVNGAPSDVTKLEDVVKIETSELEAKPAVLDESNTENADVTQGQRQKRWYDFGGYGVPPPISPAFPTYVKRDQSPSTGVYGLVDDPLSHVFRQLQGIASIARQPPSFPPAFPPSFPIYLPVIYLPQPCNCKAQNPQGNKNGTQPGSIESRFPEMEDTRQNWGYVVDDNEDVDESDDVSRPINFDIIPPKIPITRPPPPVEHGSVQGDGTINNINPGGRPTTSIPSTTTRRPPPSSQNVPKVTSTSNELPTNCDAAVLSCCHQPQITYECFTTQGCPNVSFSGNPCEPSVILKVIDRFQKFYQQRTG